MLGAILLRQQMLAPRFGGRIAERFFGGAIELRHALLPIDRDDRVIGGINDRAEARGADIQLVRQL